MSHSLIARLHDWRDLLAPSAISGAQMDGPTVRALIGTLVAVEAALTDRVEITIDLDPSEYSFKPVSNHL